ncbi:hypothetical protein [Streptomyces sp. A0592]|uniref:hypothetical protein n=1 Tax=Streptomyces sp. A0592 TaxID=2563099 RepID=UPI00109EC00E|nr:hypothetical protein [Streptomyces sp. A0592]THA82773.1 hypothetical protein E6U81_19730 [Streptomyces sp. A0592]
MPDPKPVDGPIPVHVRTIPGGAQLDLTALTRLVVGDVLDALLEGDDTTLWDLLHEVAAPSTGAADRLDREELEQQLVERASSRVPVYGPQVRRLAASLLKAARQHIPARRDAA